MEQHHTLQTIEQTYGRELTDFLVLAYSHHDAAHNIDHALAVYNNAMHIALSVDGPTTREFAITMLFHDARDHKMKVCLDAEILHDFYVGQVGIEACGRIETTHATCSWSRRHLVHRRDLFCKILQDADWIEAIGEVGLRRCIEYTQAVGGAVPHDVCAHIHEKLLLIPLAVNFDVTRGLIESKNMIKPLTDYLRAHR